MNSSCSSFLISVASAAEEHEEFMETRPLSKFWRHAANLLRDRCNGAVSEYADMAEASPCDPALEEAMRTLAKDSFWMLGTVRPDFADEAISATGVGSNYKRRSRASMLALGMAVACHEQAPPHEEWAEFDNLVRQLAESKPCSNSTGAGMQRPRDFRSSDSTSDNSSNSECIWLL